nr:Ig-like domain-containing protein [Caballeronia sp. SEWSISQ10-4 2]
MGTSRPTVTGSADAGDVVMVYDGARLIGTVVANADGPWSYSTTVDIKAGKHQFTVIAMDSNDHDNWSASSEQFVTVVSVTGPQSQTPVAPTITDVSITATPVLTGKSAAGNYVQLFDGADLITTIIANGQGVWSYTATNLHAGSHDFTAVAVDIKGNHSASSASCPATIPHATLLSAVASPVRRRSFVARAGHKSHR